MKEGAAARRRKALSSEEAQAVVEKIEAGRAEAEREKSEPTDHRVSRNLPAVRRRTAPRVSERPAR